MKLAWKLSIPQLSIVLCLGLISLVATKVTITTMYEHYVQDVVANSFNRVTKEIETCAHDAVRQTALFVRLPVVAQAYEMAFGGNIDDPYSPQSQAARELLRKELAPMLDSYRAQFGDRLQLHFHLPNARSLVRLWRDKQTKIKGESIDASDDLVLYRPTILEAIKTDRVVMGIELGSGGFAIRGVMPVHAPDGRLIGTAEVLRDFKAILDAITEKGQIELILYVNKKRIDLATDVRNPVAIATELQDPEKNPHTGDFVRVTAPMDDTINTLITPELLSNGQNSRIFAYHDAMALATLPIHDYRGTQLGVLVCAINTKTVTKLARTTELILVLLLTSIALLPLGIRLLLLPILVTRPLNLIKNKIQDITEDRADLSERIPSRQKDEIGDLARWFNALTTKVSAMLDEMREADERMRAMHDATPFCANFWNENLTIIDCNQEAVRLFELSGKQEYCDRFYELSPQYQPNGEASAEKMLAFVKKAFEEGSCHCDWLHQKLNGEPVQCELIFVRIKFQKNYIVAGYLRDLRERTMMLNTVRNEAAKFETMAHWYASILDAIPFPISVQDIYMRWTFINAPLEKLLGKPRKELLGVYCGTWGLSICDTANCAVVCAKRGLTQTRFFHEDASYQVDVAVLRGLQGETTGFLEVIQDVTQLEYMAKQQAEAETANRAKSAFLATMSHEIRTPMNAILGITEIQLQNEKLSQDTQEAFGKIYTSGYTLLGIINDLLDLSKIEAGKMALMPAKYELVSLISDTAHLNATRLSSKPIVFKIEVDENAPLELYGDELRVKQILNNLLSNAFKYTKAGEVSLEVTTEYECRHENPEVTLVCRVRDTGQGMTEEQVRDLFSEYSRFNMEANRLIEGTGLGMNITQHLVRLMRGEIFVESEPGRGSTFTVHLPQKNVGTGILGKELAEHLRHFDRSMQRMKIAHILREPMPYGTVLIVDDLETNVYVAKGLMAPYGLSVDTSMSGFGAINKIRDGKLYDVIFMDHMMPRMDGVEATKILRNMGYTHPIIALTANAVVGQAEMFLENGFDGFISKPIDLRQLNEVLNRWVRDKQPPEVIDAARRQKDVPQAGDMALQSLVDQQLARVFVRDAAKTIAALEAIYVNKCRRDDDMQMFVINVHAMKSALANIGKPDLAAVALKLEQAGRAEDIDVVLAGTPAFLNALREVNAKLTPKEENEDSEARDEDPTYLREKLLAIQEACAAHDNKVAKNALAGLRQKVWSRETKEQLNTIAEHLLHSDFEEAADVAGRLCAR